MMALDYKKSQTKPRERGGSGALVWSWLLVAPRLAAASPPPAPGKAPLPLGSSGARRILPPPAADLLMRDEPACELPAEQGLLLDLGADPNAKLQDKLKFFR